MNVQIITAPNGERMAVLPEAEFLRLLSVVEDASDRAALDAHDRAVAEGREEMVPSEIAERFFSGENPVRVWREYRGLSLGSLASAAGIAADEIARIESGERQADLDERDALAKALDLTIDDLA